MGVWFILRISYLLFYFLSSPFLFVYDDDRVIRYTGANVDIGDAEDVQATKWGLALGLELGFLSHVFYYVFHLWTQILGTCNTFIIYVISFGACFHKFKFSRVGSIINATFDIFYFFYYLF